MEQNKKRILWMDGLRGFCCLAIFGAHFIACFCPDELFPVGLLAVLKQTPLASVVNGSVFLVYLFCILAGMAASFSVFRFHEMGLAEQERLSTALINRYLRMFLPVFCLNVIIFAMLRFGIMSNRAFSERIDYSNWSGMLYSDFGPDSTVLTLLLDSFVRVPFEGSTKFCQAYWCLPHLFYGYFLSVILSEMSWGKSKKIQWVYAFFTVCLLLARLDMTASFPVGTAIALWMKNRRETGTEKWIPGALLVLLGLVLGGFPFYTKPVGLYTWLDFSILKIPPYMLWSFLGAASVMVGLVLCKPIQHMLASKVFQLLGRYSFSIYLVHIAVITSLGTGLAVAFIDAGKLSYPLICTVVFAAVSAALIPICLAFHRFVEKPCEKLTRFVIRKLSE